MEIYVVEPGDSVDSIGAAFGVDPGQVGSPTGGL